MMKFTLTRLAVAGLLFFSIAGCKRTPGPVAPVPTAAPEPTRTPSKPSVVVEPPQENPSPTSTPMAEATPARILYVNSPFQAVSEVGTHDFPVNAKVSLVAIEGDDYVVEYNGVSVKNDRAYFSDQPIDQPEAAPTPASSAIPPASRSEVASEPTPDPTDALVPDGALLEEEKAATEKLNKIRDLNEEIRAAEQKPDDAAEVKKLKKRRNKLSEDLTRTAKP
jgi:hypothetical protein